MRLTALALPAALAAALLLPAAAQAASNKAQADEAKHSTVADPRIAKQLDGLGYKYEVDEDGDYKLTFEMDDDRSQLGFVISRTESYGKHKVREVWAPAYRSENDAFPADLANKLLEDSQSSKMGGWVKQGNMAVFVVKLRADAPAEELDDALDYALRAADLMEAELTPGKDEF